MRASERPRKGIFISYARADGEAAARSLHERLSADLPEIPAWLDRFEIEGGVGWWNQIEKQLDRAEFLVSVLEGSILLAKARREPSGFAGVNASLVRYLASLKNPARPLDVPISGGSAS